MDTKMGGGFYALYVTPGRACIFRALVFKTAQITNPCLPQAGARPVNIVLFITSKIIESLSLTSMAVFTKFENTNCAL